MNHKITSLKTANQSKKLILFLKTGKQEKIAKMMDTLAIKSQHLPILKFLNPEPNGQQFQVFRHWINHSKTNRPLTIINSLIKRPSIFQFKKLTTPSLLLLGNAINAFICTKGLMPVENWFKKQPPETQALINKSWNSLYPQEQNLLVSLETVTLESEWLQSLELTGN